MRHKAAIVAALAAGVSTLAACASMPQPETPYIICADNAVDCGDEIDVEIVGNFSPSTGD